MITKNGLITYNIILLLLFIFLSFASSWSTSFMWIIGIVSIGVSIYLYALYKNNERLKQIESDYFEALKGNDKAEALRLGRIYYGSLREDGNVTIYDEQAISNDMNSMTNTVHVVNTVIHKKDNEETRLETISEKQKTLYCSKCGKAYVPNVEKKFCEECGNRY